MQKQIIQALVRKRIAEIAKQPLERVKDDLVLSDLVVESFALIEMAIGLQEEFSVTLTGEDLSRINTVGDLSHLIASRGSTGSRVHAP